MVRRSAALLALATLVAGSVSAGQEGERLDRYGGWLEGRSAATGWFRTATSGGRWWLVDPEGHLFLSIGVNSVCVAQELQDGDERHRYRDAATARHGRASVRAKATVQRLKRWGFNTLGPGCERGTLRYGMPYTATLAIAGVLGGAEERSFPDVFDPAYVAAVREHVRSECRWLARDPSLIGYYTDGRLDWVGGRWGRQTLFVEYLARDDSAPGRRKLVETLERWYLNVGELNRAWGTSYDSFGDVGRTPQVGSCIPDKDVDGFLEVIAKEYFRVAHEAIRAVDERHLILGCQLASPPPEPVLRAMGDYVDAVSLNHSGDAPPAADLRAVHRITGKPTIVTPLGGPGQRRERLDLNDADRRADAKRESAAWYESYILDLVALPMVVGFHWPDYADRPAEAGPSTASGVLGLVDAQGVPHAELVEMIGGVNHSIYRRASKMGSQAAP